MKERNLLLGRFAKGKKSYDFQKIKAERELERFKKHKALRKYEKLCKAEGIVSNRIRIHGNTTADETTSDDRTENIPKFKKKKINLIEEAEKVAEEKKKLKEEKEKELARIEESRQQKIKERNENRKQNMKRTKKGQPILHNKINNILEKLKREKGVN
jgi:hypothetical protein